MNSSSKSLPIFCAVIVIALVMVFSIKSCVKSGPIFGLGAQEAKLQPVEW